MARVPTEACSGTSQAIFMVLPLAEASLDSFVFLK
jgi:hypothetical protein